MLIATIVNGRKAGQSPFVDQVNWLYIGKPPCQHASTKPVTLAVRHIVELMVCELGV